MSESSSPMRRFCLKLEKELIGISGSPFQLDENRTLTLKDVAVEGLLMPRRGLTPEDKFVQFQLAKDIHDGRSELSEAEFILLKNTVGQVYDQAIMGAAWRELDNQAATFQRQEIANSQETPTLCGAVYRELS